MIIDNTKWYQAIQTIRNHVRDFCRLLESNNEEIDNVVYIKEWIAFYSNVNKHREQLLKVNDDLIVGPELSWTDMVQFLFADDIKNVHDFIDEVLKLVPPIRYILEVIMTPGKKCVLQQRYFPLQAFHYSHQLTLH